MKTIHFNTGRKYTANGQRITATLHDDGVVTFWDHDRMVHGEISCRDPANFTQAKVMNDYDHNLHANTTRAWQDGMQRGGVNSVYK